MQNHLVFHDILYYLDFYNDILFPLMLMMEMHPYIWEVKVSSVLEWYTASIDNAAAAAAAAADDDDDEDASYLLRTNYSNSS